MPVNSQFIGGEWIDTGDHRVVVDPADNTRVVDTVSWASEDEAYAAIAAADACAPAWAELPAKQRSQILHQTATLIDQRRDEMARSIVEQEGKSLSDALGECSRAATLFRYFATTALLPNGALLPADARDVLTTVRRIPIGIVGLVTPFNYPLLVPAWKLAPALAAGNTIVWKCSELASLAAIHLTRCLADAGVPAGTVNLLVGDAAPSRIVTTDRRVRAISFTGSTGVGKQVRSDAIAHGARVQLELGGSNPAVVLADADLGVIAPLIADGAFSGTGQKCAAIRRLIVMRDQHDAIVDSVVDVIAKWRLGPGLEPSSDLQPLASPTQLDRAIDGIQQSIASGATVRFGGSRPSDPALSSGNYLEPTVLTGVGPSTHTWSEEIFGPVLSVIAVDSEDEAIAVANATKYGLNAGLFTRDLDRAMTLAPRIRAGMVHVNAVTGFPAHVPFGGLDDSGYGPLEQGPNALDFYSETAVLNIHPKAGS